MNPSPTRGLNAGWVASLGIGKAPSVIILASSAPASTYAFSNELGARTPSWLVCCSTTAITRSASLTGMAWVSTGSPACSFRSLVCTISPLKNASDTTCSGE